ncbi:hypothetical protein [bacterium endosymbiont of Bathymodiolus sp. 5 South]|uniref:hypothetical protein n=1 Tax=bacterium endosymbiont of Bathymodiolus sp. 5 South TaxID=1181670 RepID=UPI0010B37122|nr:hypothetical protein [bacterium endosymbiont of Bathymodiolus sp. 5 South]CAC9452610.1 hypothetical protein [uncultured Gammaproteobacteria bacterium]CAC9452850.1 hypothetical protein [uncultured Gammaproteobacteria bacterium]CAC9463841.1 hypothetical protein [uncultured Gammaproteobacteria bacterium]CAC9654165.1 hypothetical protein [uncultured Gammaproteobacteria bacterium]SSC07143.1 hypothetical protein BTURTLESOX_1080 [bacterium endosymbiont of Bathymodiolus sp. 5 South]
MKKIFLTLVPFVSILSIKAYAGIPTKVGAINIDSNDVLATLWELAQQFIYYGAWIAIAAALITGMFTIIGALSEARKKGDSGILWSSIAMTMVVVILIVVFAILLISYMDI